MAAPPPVLVIVLCGKRKSGKDYVAARLQEMLGDTLSIIRISQPLKTQYAKEHGLDIQRLMDSSSYKETFRKDMIRWGEEMRAKDPGYFCQLAATGSDKPVWLVCDARRPTDMEYFKSLYFCRTVRVVASEEVRRKRGWVFVKDVDDAASECALDDYLCDLTVNNEGREGELMEGLEEIRTLTKQRLCKLQ